MKPLLRRILVNGGMVAVVLGVIGMMLGELTAMWILASQPDRPQLPESLPDLTAVRQRLPIVMAAAGFAIVALGELGMHVLQRNRSATASKSTAPDLGERLLEELLTQAEAKAARMNRPPSPPHPLSPSERGL